MFGRKFSVGHLFNRTLVVAHSDAMRPGIFAGDVLVVRRPRDNGAGYGVGDVVAYRTSDSGRSAHVRRICDVRRNGGLPLGDGSLRNESFEYLVRSDNDTHGAPLTTAQQGSAISIVRPHQIVGAVESRLAHFNGLSRTSRAKRSPYSLSAFAPVPNARRMTSPSSPAPNPRRRVPTTQVAAD
jgi:hypothetical protein